MNCALHAESSHAGIGKQFLKKQTHAPIKLKEKKIKIRNLAFTKF